MMADQKPPPTPYRPPASSTTIDVTRIDNKINQSLRKQVTDAIRKNPKLGLAIVRGWKDQDR